VSRCSTGPIRRTPRKSRSSTAARWIRPSCWAPAPVGVLVQTATSSAPEIAARLDIFELTPTPADAERDRLPRSLIHFDYLKRADQQQVVMPASFAVARRVCRSAGGDPKGLPAVRRGSTSSDALTRAERGRTNAARCVEPAAARLNTDAQGSSDQAKVQLLIAWSRPGRVNAVD